MRARVLTSILLLAVSVAARGNEMARYEVRLAAGSAHRLVVRATLPVSGDALEMSDTRPGDVPALDTGGWPALVRDLRVVDRDGRAVRTEPLGAKGWRIEAPRGKQIRLTYEVDYSALAELDWPAQREAAFADADHFAVIGRSLFITTRAASAIDVHFDAPRGWSVVTPWPRTPSRDDLIENFIVFSRKPVETITASGFSVRVIPTGWWEGARADVRRVLGVAIPRLVQLIGFRGRARYVVLLLPAEENGGEAFRSSFALTVERQPSAENSDRWGNTIAHEVFHYWNGSRLRGSEYAASQWFQEGFTEYAANLAMVSSGLIGEAAFREKLAQHIDKSAKLTTTLEAPGSRKGPPLYSRGALVAFCWDVMIRHATSGRRDIGDLFRALWRETAEGRDPYDWPRIKAALESTTTAVDWEDFYRRYIRGSEPPPMADVLPLVGLRLAGAAIEIDPAAPPDARRRWEALTSPHHTN